MKNTRNALLSISLASALIMATSFASAQPTNPTPDLSMLTNHAALTEWAFKQIQGISVSTSSGLQAQNNTPSLFAVITNQVKTLDTLSAAVGPYWWGMELTDTNNAYIDISAQFMNTSNNPSYVYTPDAYALFYAYGGGPAVKNAYGSWTLATNDSTLSIQLAQQVRIKIPGLVDARVVVNDQTGQYGEQFTVINGELYWNSDYDGIGTIVLVTQFQDTNGNWWGFTTGYSLTNSAKPVTLTWVDFAIMLRDSDDFKSFKDAAVMDVSAYSFQDSYLGLAYGKTPLLVATYTKLTKGVTLSVHSIDGQYATSYVVEDQRTGVKTTVVVPPNATSVQHDFPAGDYYIVPGGINLHSIEEYYGGYGVVGVTSTKG